MSLKLVRNRERLETLAGAIALIFGVLVLLYFYGRNPNINSKTRSHYQVSARFNRADGITLGDEVRVAGIPVGRVTAQRLDDNYGVVLVFQIAANVLLPEDSSAAINTNGIFGKKYIEIVPGGMEEMIKNDGRISYTQDSMVVEELLEKIIAIGKSVRNIKNENQENVSEENLN